MGKNQDVLLKLQFIEKLKSWVEEPKATAEDML